MSYKKTLKNPTPPILILLKSFYVTLKQVPMHYAT